MHCENLFCLLYLNAQPNTTMFKNILCLLFLGLFGITTDLCAQSSAVAGIQMETTVPTEVEIENAEIYFELFPNPFTDLVYVKTVHKIESIEVADENGKQVYFIDGGNELDLGHLPSGDYMLRIKFEHGEAAKMLHKS